MPEGVGYSNRKKHSTIRPSQIKKKSKLDRKPKSAKEMIGQLLKEGTGGPRKSKSIIKAVKKIKAKRGIKSITKKDSSKNSTNRATQPGLQKKVAALKKEAKAFADTKEKEIRELEKKSKAKFEKRLKAKRKAKRRTQTKRQK